MRSIDNNKKSFTFIDLYAGIGGFRIALENAGGKCLGFSEIDRDAIQTYKSNFILTDSQELELGDVTKLDALPEVDVLVGGVPCQSWSVAGKMRGFDDPRGRLWLDTIRLVETNKPKAFIFENVKGLMDPRNKANLDLIIDSFKNLGYHVSHKLLNSYDFGLPQNRDRIYIVGLREDLVGDSTFSFPDPKRGTFHLADFLDGVDLSIEKKKKFEPADIFGEKIPFGRNRFQKKDELNDFFVFCDTRDGHTTIHSWDLVETSDNEKRICTMILKNRRKKTYGPNDGNPIPFSAIKKQLPDIKKEDIISLMKKKILREKKGSGFEFVNSKNSAGINGVYRIYLPNSSVFSTLTATGTKDRVATISIQARNVEEFKRKFISQIYKKGKFRKIKPIEACRLQGFPESFKLHRRDDVAHRQFGNAVSVPVVYNVIKAILNTEILNKDPKWTTRRNEKSSRMQRVG